MQLPKSQQALPGFDGGSPPNRTPQRSIERSANETTIVSGEVGSVTTVAAADSPQTTEDSNRTPTAYLVDGHSLVYQVFHAMPSDMSSPTGQPVGAVHGFIRDMLELLEKKKPDYLICAFDPPGDVFRQELYPLYKANREPMPDDLRPQIPAILQMLDALGIPVLQKVGFEADDVLATLATQGEQRGMDCFVVTSDKDCRQLISDRVRLYNIRKDRVMDAAALMDDWGVRPEQVVDFQALVGDKVDNIPGVPLIGPKIARELLQKYGTLESVLDHAGEVSGTKRRENLIKGRQDAMASRELVRLVRDVPVEIDWQAARVAPPNAPRVAELCREFGFRQLATRLGALTDEPLEDAPTEPTWKADYQTVADEAALDRLVSDLGTQTQISIDTETTSTNPRWAEIVGYSFAWKAGEAVYIPVRAPAGQPQLDADLVCEKLRPVLENPAIEKIGQNLKYDIVVLRSAGIELRGAAFDTMVADYLVEPGERNHSIDDLARRYLDHETIKISSLIGTGKKQKRMDQVPVELITAYAAEDADVPLRLIDVLQQRLKRDELDGLFRDVEMPLIDVLAEMEFNGIRVDKNRLREMGERFAERMAAVEHDIYEIAGKSFNIDSRLQLAEVLFDQLRLPVVKKTKSGPSTDVEVLTELAAQHELPAKIIEYRQFAKLKSTYIDSLAELVHPQTGRVHTSFKQDVAATGRLSSNNPNLQNIPVRNEEGRAIRSAFLPGADDWLLMTADYSQIELRVLAHFSGDDTLKEAFGNDEDIHARVAAEVQGVPLEQVTRDMRRSAKAVNFGVIYGQSPFGLARALSIAKDEAAAFIDAYFARYPGVDKFITETLTGCRANGYVKTILGRRRPVSGVRDPNVAGVLRQRNLPERIAVNTVIQGSAADLIKLAMIRVHDRLQTDGLRSKLLLQIHDELVFETPPDEADRLVALVREEMVNVQQLAVPLKVDVKTGPNWAACEPMD